MQEEELIRDAIVSKKLFQFTYKGVTRLVEPHMLAYNSKNAEVLSAWFISGGSVSGSGPGWREYLLVEIVDGLIVDESFDGPRPGYVSDGGAKFHNVLCAL